MVIIRTDAPIKELSRARLIQLSQSQLSQETALCAPKNDQYMANCDLSLHDYNLADRLVSCRILLRKINSVSKTTKPAVLGRLDMYCRKSNSTPNRRTLRLQRAIKLLRE